MLSYDGLQTMHASYWQQQRTFLVYLFVSWLLHNKLCVTLVRKTCNRYCYIVKKSHFCLAVSQENMEWLFYNHISQSEATVLQLIFSVLMFFADWCEVHSSVKQGSKNQVKEDIRAEITAREKKSETKIRSTYENEEPGE